MQWPSVSTAKEGIKLSEARDARVALVGEALHDWLGGDWSVERAANGWTNRSFVATDGLRRVFVKLDVRFDVLRHLAELGVAPSVAQTGHHRGQWVVVQEFVEGSQPDTTWFADNIAAVAVLVGRYHRDDELTAMLTPTTGITYRDVVERTLADLEQRAATLPAAAISPADLRRAVAMLRGESRRIHDAPLVPTHGDPNRRNFVLRGRRPYLVDWDELALADPVRDIGQILWWYVPEQQWDEALPRFGLDPGRRLLRRLYWWIAAEFLEVTLTTAEAGLLTDAKAFFGDFTAALHHQPNPRAS